MGENKTAHPQINLYEAFRRLEDSELIPVVNGCSHKLSADKNTVKAIQKAFYGAEFKLKQMERLCLEARLPVTVLLPEARRANSLTITAALLYAIRTDDSICSKIKGIFLQSNLGKLEGQHFKNAIVDVDYDSRLITLNLEDLGLTEAIGLLLRMYFDRENSTEEQFGGAMKYVLHMLHPALPITSEDASKTIEGCAMPQSHKSLKEYVRAWNEYCAPQGEEGTYVDPVLSIEQVLANTGISYEFLVNEAMVTKRMNADAAQATVYSLISLSEDEDGEYRFKTKEELYGIAKNDNVLKQGIDTAFTFALFINMMCEKYSKEVKASLRKELFGNVSKNHVSEFRNEKMHKELSELRKANKSLLLQRDELQRYRESSLKRENALQAKLEKALDEISQLEQALDEDNINLDDSQAEGPALELSIELGDGSFDLDDEEDYSLRLNGLLGENKVVFVGGNENLMKKFRNRNPNAITIHNKEIAVCDNLIKNADAVFFKVDSMSHGLYEKCKSIAQKANVPVAYIPEITSVKMIEKTAYEMLTSMLVKKEG